jgi:hypothetical protein
MRPVLTPLRKHSTDLFQKPTKAPSKPRRYEEHSAQAMVVKWLRLRPDWMIIRVENAMDRRYGANRDKMLGLHPGAPDLWLCYKTKAVWVEMKSDGGKVTEEQAKCHAELRARGQCVIVGHGFEQARLALEDFESKVDAEATNAIRQRTV